ncbi:MAG: DegT/DnrJ/EryC1/StrS family aminotransferase [Betaproteobacteria bacterium]
MRASREEFLVFGQPDIQQEDIDELLDSVRKNWLGTGPKAAEFERRFAAYKGVESAAAVYSCTAALQLAMIAIDIQPGDEVITSPLTFCATVNAIVHAGGVPVLADIEPGSMNISPQEIEKKLSPRTRAIVPVHFAGRPCDMDWIMRIAEDRNLKVIEDCAHAIETEYHGKKAGTLGHFGCFSFYATKNLATGEGGMVLAKNREDLDRIRVLALHGMNKDAWKRFSDAGYKHYQVVECGFKYNMMDIQASLGIHQIARIGKMWERRKELWSIYRDELASCNVTLPAMPDPDTIHGYHLFTILVSKQKSGIDRDEFLVRMGQKKIGVGVHYLSVAEHPVYQEMFGWQPEMWPVSCEVGRTTVSLPFSPKLTDADVADVMHAVKTSLIP